VFSYGKENIIHKLSDKGTLLGHILIESSRALQTHAFG